jgi:asparagine synthase (glutamine-hydrolysing)
MPGSGVEEPRAFASLDRALEEGLRPWRDASGPLTVLFSGGVDSGLLAWELRARAGLELLTVGSAGAADLTAARESAARIGQRVRTVEVKRDEVVAAVGRWSTILEGVPSVHRAVLVAFAVALAHTAPGPVLCGQGPDELFLGYAHFRGLDPLGAEERSRLDLRSLLDEDAPRVDRIAAQLDRRIASPFLDPGFVAAARAIPIEARMPFGRPKSLFRRWAVHRGLPAETAERPKRALQYGSGIARMLARAASPTAESTSR